MNIREYLENYNNVGDEIRRLNSELNRLLECREDTYNTIKAQTLSDMPRSPMKQGDDVVSKAAILTIERFVKSVNCISLRIKDLLDMQDEFNQVWFKPMLLSSEEKRIIELRFFHEKQWDEVAVKVGYSERHCTRLAMMAIDKMQTSLGDCNDTR